MSRDSQNFCLRVHMNLPSCRNNKYTEGTSVMDQIDYWSAHKIDICCSLEEEEELSMRESLLPSAGQNRNNQTTQRSSSQPLQLVSERTPVKLRSLQAEIWACPDLTSFSRIKFKSPQVFMGKKKEEGGGAAKISQLLWSTRATDVL